MEIRKCRVCGCTDQRACNPPCYWIEEDLCSACRETNCEICGESSSTTDIQECSYCGKKVCSENEKCSEVLNNGDELACKSCVSKWPKYDCNKCVNDDCPYDRSYSYCYNCEEYIESKKL